jgi:hypothetical protein
MSNELIPVYSGPDSVKPGSKGRTIKWTDDTEEHTDFVFWPLQYMHRYAPMKSPKDGHILTDDEIQRLLDAVSHGFNASAFESTEQFIEYITYRQQIPEKVYGMYENDISVCRFFQDGHGEKQENILADIKKLNAEQGMGNIIIPDTNIEIINYSPCPKCGHIHSFSDIFSYYQNPIPDPKFISRNQQYSLDTRVMCIECNTYFLPALIVSDGSPKVEHQMICRMQTVREVAVYMKMEFKIQVLMYNENNVLKRKQKGKEERAWRNDVDAAKLKQKQGLFTNFLQYTPAPLMLDFLSRKNLELEEPLYGVWKNPQEVQYINL